MKVGIDAWALGSHWGGDETYIRNVIRALPAVDPSDDYTLFVNPWVQQDTLNGADHTGMRRVIVRTPHARLRLPAFALAMAGSPVDVLHVQYLAPLICPARLVVSVHDIAYERYPEFFPPRLLRLLRRVVPRTIGRATAVLTLSEFSKRDIVEFYGLPPEKVIVAPCAPDPMFQPLADEARLAMVRRRYNTGGRFILCVGNLQPRKNLKTLINAYVRLRVADVIRHKLVVVGAKAWLFDDTFATARETGYQDELVFTEYVPDDDLVALYNAADVFVYPSIFEGFGLPPVEAMACGTPVVTSNTSSLPEVVGDAALTVAPLDVDALADALAALLRDDALREQLARQGLQRAATFSWEASARIIHGAYVRAAARVPPGAS